MNGEFAGVGGTDLEYGPGSRPAGIGAIPGCRLRHGFVNGRRLTKEAHVPFTKPQAAKTGKAESPFVRLKKIWFAVGFLIETHGFIGRYSADKPAGDDKDEGGDDDGAYV